ncbi:DUF2975 domain-containing protein [Brachybacterium paraconglomeratum]|uniref:DUF2975 domain-containing protein n=1 Tax=Brachybacterium paraconglomeratum TaxID=173362 RepID=UPI003FCF850E
MTPILLRRIVIIALEISLALALLACLFAQIVIVPSALAAEAVFDPVIARAQVVLTIIGIAGIACFEVVAIATGMLLLHSWNERIFSRRPLKWVDAIIAACLVAGVLCFVAMVADLVSPPLPAGTFPADADDSTSNSLLIFGFAGGVGCIAAALVIGVMRDLLTRAVAYRVELDQVI